MMCEIVKLLNATTARQPQKPSPKTAPLVRIDILAMVLKTRPHKAAPDFGRTGGKSFHGRVR
jgi:hypothetical protein